jgi:hypothetical protein
MSALPDCPQGIGRQAAEQVIGDAFPAPVSHPPPRGRPLDDLGGFPDGPVPDVSVGVSECGSPPCVCSAVVCDASSRIQEKDNYVKCPASSNCS